MKEQISNKELLFSKIEDKIKFCNSKNKITFTDFFTMPEKVKIEKYLKEKHISNYFFFGARPNADREILIFYPPKISYEMAFKNLKSIVKILRITLPNSLKGTYEHRDFLSGLMKLGLIREKFGDIIVTDFGAEIILFKENSEFVLNNLGLLTRFRKCNLEILDFNELTQTENKFEDFTIIVNSLRIDNFISEITHSSRAKTEEILNDERVLLNYEPVLKGSKQVKISDILVIKGYGKFIIDDFIRSTSSQKSVYLIKKQC